jgi:replication initiation and membrane attachment protein DnaB
MIDNRTGSEAVQVNDEYNFMLRSPLDPAAFSTAMQFTANLADLGGDSAFDTVSVEVTNTNTTVNDKFTYTIRVKS